MVKNNTLIILVCAVILAGAVYYLDFRHPKDDTATKDTSQLALSLKVADVTGVTLSHPARTGDLTTVFEKHGDNWQITQPVATAADDPTIEGLVELVAGARVSQTEPGGADRRKVYGLDPPRTQLELRLANGSRHTLLLGDKDFTGDSVYTVVDGAQNVSLLPSSLFESVNKPLDDLRDRAVLHFDTATTTSFDLKNSSGEFTVVRVSKSGDKDAWEFTKPSDSIADSDAVSSLLAGVASAKFTSVASETADNLAKYGLSTPAITFSVTDAKGATAALLVGKKDGDNYFASDSSRPTIFRIDADLDQKLSQKFSDLRDKQVLHVDTSDIQSLQLHSAKGDLAASRKKDAPDEWDFDAPADQKGKTMAAWKILDPLTGLRAEEIIEHPAGPITAKLAKPVVTVMWTDKSGKPSTARISAPDGDFAYVQISGNMSIYKVKKQVVDDLSLSAADATP